jgi:glutamate/tyrosine decarboxylase-like PLP-dependent enzyme
VDDLNKIIKMRKEFEKEGLTFYIHVDAAWGGYFASTIHKAFGGICGQVQLFKR